MKIEKMKYPNTVAENAKICDEYIEQAKYFAQNIIDEFLPMCDIPHPSGHVEEMRKYLLEWGENHGVETHLDSSGCVYMDLPATKGFEQTPKVIFQAHYDMVAVAEKHNTSFDPLTSPIKPIYDKDEGIIHTG